MSDRHQQCTVPLVITKGEWARIGRWTSQERDDPDARRRRDYVNYLDVTSREMTKRWPNSVENVNKRNEELRRARVEASERANSRFYKKYLRNKKEEQERLMHSARDVIFKNKDAPKLMLSAVIASCTIQERDAQVKFLRELKRQKKEQAQKADAEVVRHAQEWEEHVAQQKQRRKDANKQHQRDILEQAHEYSEKNRKEYEEELQMQILDNMQANEQINALKEFEDKFRITEKARILAELRQEGAEAGARAAARAAGERAGARLRHVLAQSRDSIERLRRKTEHDERAAKLKVLEAISSKLESGDAARDAQEQEILNNAKKKADIEAEARVRESEKHLERMRAERHAARELWLRDEEQRVHEARNMLHWDCINRFKNMELTADNNKKNRDMKQQKIKQFRDDMLAQMKEREERSAREKAETRYFYGELAEKKMRDADSKMLSHAAALLREARDNGRPELPLRACIQKYCKMHRLNPMALPDLSASMKEQEAQGHTQKHKSTKQQPIVKREEATESEDYRRKGPANGLQLKENKEQMNLQAMTVIPCVNAECRCALRE